AHLTAYRNGMWILWEELVNAVMHRPVLQKELLLRAAWAFQHLDIVGSAVSEAYHAEQEGRARHRDRMLRELFDEIIEGGSSSAEELEARAVSVDLDLDLDFHVFVFPLGSSRGGSPRTADLSALAMVVAEAASLTVERVVSIERSRELVLLVPCGEEDFRVAVLRSAIAEALEPTIRAGVPLVAGVSGIVRRVPGVRQGYKEAKRAAEIGQMLDPTNVVYFYDDYVLQDVLDSGAAAGRRLIGEALGPLLSVGETGQRLMETLRAYFRAGSNLKVAAASLDIHPNTLSYRMRQIHQLTGLDPGHPEQRLRAEIALQLFSMEQRREELSRTGQSAAGGRAAPQLPRAKGSSGARAAAAAKP
ncbi:MAG: PucR family transcriptional regulator, partial [Candidatus Binatia bacterium]